MLQELVSAVERADERAAEVAARFAAGDPADDALRTLADAVAAVVRLAGCDDSAGGRAAVAGLYARLSAAAAAGDGWLARAGGPELASLSAQERVAKAYRRPSG